MGDDSTVFNIVTFGKRPENLVKSLETGLIGSSSSSFEASISKNSLIFLHCQSRIWGTAKPFGNYFFDKTPVWSNGIYPHRFKINDVSITIDPLDMLGTSINSEFRKRFGIGWAYKFIFSPRPIPDDIGRQIQEELNEKSSASLAELRNTFLK